MISNFSPNYYLEDLVKNGSDNAHKNNHMHAIENHHTTPIITLTSKQTNLHLSTYFAPEYSLSRPLILVRLIEDEKEDKGIFNALFVDPKDANSLEMIALESFLMVTNKNKDSLSITNVPTTFSNAYIKNNYIKELEKLSLIAQNNGEDDDYSKYVSVLSTLYTFPKI